MNRTTFSNEQMRRYFDNDVRYGTAIWFMLAGIVGLALAFVPAIVPQNYTLIVILVGLILLAIGTLLARRAYYSIPSDAEYDTWVESQINRMMDHARAKLHAGSTETLQLIDSVVLPGTQATRKDNSRKGANYLEGEVRAKQGKDTLWRYSTHDCTIILPAAAYLATFNAKVSALNQGRHELHATQEYSYSDIVGVTTNTLPDQVWIKDTPYDYSIEECSFKVSNGGEIVIGAAINARPLQVKSKLPILSTTNASATVNNLRLLLRTKKQGRGQI